MVRLTKIYTRTGDGGKTRLVGGQQVAKNALRIEAYGTVDELNATMGMVRVALEAGGHGLDDADRDATLKWVGNVQQHLFNLGSDLATLTDDRWEGMPLIEAADIVSLEKYIDRLNAHLEPLKSFVLPGGGEVSARLHLARTVCRRAERRAISLADEEDVNADALVYLNRLSDALFVLSRWVAKRGGKDEVLWMP